MDGKEIRYSTVKLDDGKTQIKLDIHIKLYDATKQLSEEKMNSYISEFKKGIEEIYSKSFVEQNIEIQAQVSIEKTDNPQRTDFVVYLVNEVEGAERQRNNRKN